MHIIGLNPKHQHELYECRLGKGLDANFLDNLADKLRIRDVRVGFTTASENGRFERWWCELDNLDFVLDEMKKYTIVV